MTRRSGIYIVPTDRWYIERTVWLISGVILLGSTAIAALYQPLAILLVVATGLSSMFVGVTGYCPVGNVLKPLGFEGLLDAHDGGKYNPYRMRTDSWYLERRIYVIVGFNMTVASMLSLVHSAWWLAFTGFVGAASLWFASTGFCIMANAFYWTGAEPRLNPGAATPSPAPTGTAPAHG
ncbi:MAG: DUF2892 domain-containing protein [Proteobacteria bacterium]|nr:DUF2892 domain-containing protein [Pseudomonadota bacterium]